MTTDRVERERHRGATIADRALDIFDQVTAGGLDLEETVEGIRAARARIDEVRGSTAYVGSTTVQHREALLEQPNAELARLIDSNDSLQTAVGFMGELHRRGGGLGRFSPTTVRQAFATSLHTARPGRVSAGSVLQLVKDVLDVSPEAATVLAAVALACEAMSRPATSESRDEIGAALAAWGEHGSYTLAQRAAPPPTPPVEPEYAKAERMRLERTTSEARTRSQGVGVFEHVALAPLHAATVRPSDTERDANGPYGAIVATGVGGRVRVELEDGTMRDFSLQHGSAAHVDGHAIVRVAREGTEATQLAGVAPHSVAALGLGRTPERALPIVHLKDRSLERPGVVRR